MSGHILAITDKEEDLKFAAAVSAENGFTYTQAVNANQVRDAFVAHPKTVVLWDAENLSQYKGAHDVLLKYVKPQRLFAVTQEELQKYPHLYNVPIFGTHLMRRYNPAAEEIIGRLVKASQRSRPFGVQHYFPENTPTKEIMITRSAHKRAAIDALQNSLNKLGTPTRLSTSVAQAADELIMNAIFDAPITARGTRVRKATERHADFELDPREQVKVEIAATANYMGICVADQFGSLTKKLILDSLRRHLEKGAVQSGNVSTETGFGIHGIMQSGLSLLFVSNPKACTQMMLFFQKVDSIRDFRTSFRFLSMMDE